MPPKREHKSIEIDDHHPYIINGIKVLFPVKPYPTQITMMNKIIQGLERQQNCLLESPTGSGKSLALLCSCLAWQEAEKRRILEAEEAEEQERLLAEENHEEKVEVINDLKENIIQDDKIDDQGSDDDFVEDGKKKTTSKKHEPRKQETEKTETKSKIQENVKHNEEVETKDKKVAKIYFGTRTHKQIKQIIRELRKTIYKSSRMSILGSREFLCIHPKVSKGGEKNEECKKLLSRTEGASCRFHTNYGLLTKYNIQERYKVDEAWDVEDLVSVGKKIKACPYYGCRELAKGADIIFCPYNYLVDPLIREQMSINIKNQIIVLDEAHNIEDTARDSASISLNMIELEETQKDLQDIINTGVMPDAHSCLKMLIDGIIEWMEHLQPHLEKKGFESEAKVWNGNEISKMLSEKSTLKLNQASLKIYAEQMQKVTAIDNENNGEFGGEQDVFKLTSKSLTVLEHIMFIFGILLYEEVDYAQDYRVVLTRTSVFMPKNIQLPGGWLKKSKQLEKVWTYKLNFWCMNPAVVFSELGTASRCVILSSGTLSPMTSFSSELGVNFPITLEANHVIADSQVWVGNLTVGPSNVSVNANYRSSETFTFQDAVGKIVLQICKKISKGVLCFFPSYSMMDKLMKRWRSTALWEELSSYKAVLFEPRGGDRNEFDETLQLFYDNVSPSNEVYDVSRSVPNGALLLAVCRGKVSEGLDFSDDNARAVITIGIPFPNFKDLQVELKRKYNTDHSVNKTLLNGSDWYDIQAFRALNQALGRCIRHKNDWGALLIVDERFSKSPKYRNGLSKWVRNKLRFYHDFQSCLTNISEFADRHFAHSGEVPGDITERGNINEISNIKTEQSTNVEDFSPTKQNASKYFIDKKDHEDVSGFKENLEHVILHEDERNEADLNANSINQSKSVCKDHVNESCAGGLRTHAENSYANNSHTKETSSSKNNKSKFNFSKKVFTSLSVLANCDANEIDKPNSKVDNENSKQCNDVENERMNLNLRMNENKNYNSSNIPKKQRFSYPLSKQKPKNVNEAITQKDAMVFLPLKPETDCKPDNSVSENSNQNLIASLSKEFKNKPVDMKNLNKFKKEMKLKFEITPMKEKHDIISSTPLVSKTLIRKSPVGSPLLFDDDVHFDDVEISKIELENSPCKLHECLQDFDKQNESKVKSKINVMPDTNISTISKNVVNKKIDLSKHRTLPDENFDDDDFEDDFQPLNRSVKRKSSDLIDESKRKTQKTQASRNKNSNKHIENITVPNLTMEKSKSDCKTSKDDGIKENVEARMHKNDRKNTTLYRKDETVENIRIDNTSIKPHFVKKMVVKSTNSKTTDLMVVKSTNSKTADLMVVKSTNSKTTDLMLVKSTNSKTTDLTLIKKINAVKIDDENECVIKCVINSKSTNDLIPFVHNNDISCNTKKDNDLIDLTDNGVDTTNLNHLTSKKTLGVKRNRTNRKRNVRMSKSLNSDKKFQPISDDIDLDLLAKHDDDESKLMKCADCQAIFKGQVNEDVFITLPISLEGVSTSTKLFKFIEEEQANNFKVHDVSDINFKGTNAYYDSFHNQVYVPLFCFHCKDFHTCIGVKHIDVIKGLVSMYLVRN